MKKGTTTNKTIKGGESIMKNWNEMLKEDSWTPCIACVYWDECERKENCEGCYLGDTSDTEEVK